MAAGPSRRANLYSESEYEGFHLTDHTIGTNAIVMPPTDAAIASHGLDMVAGPFRRANLYNGREYEGFHHTDHGIVTNAIVMPRTDATVASYGSYMSASLS